jgi:hypothetical protein
MQGFLFLDGPWKIPQNFLAAQLRFHFRRRRQRACFSNALQNNVFQFCGAVDLDGIAPDRLEFQGIRDSQDVASSLHLGKSILPLFIGIHRGAHPVRRDQLHHHAFRRIPAGNAHGPGRSAGEARLHRPFIFLRSIPRIGRQGFSLDAALVAVQIADYIGHIRIGKSRAE